MGPHPPPYLRVPKQVLNGHLIISSKNYNQMYGEEMVVAKTFNKFVCDAYEHLRATAMPPLASGTREASKLSGRERDYT